VLLLRLLERLLEAANRLVLAVAYRTIVGWIGVLASRSACYRWRFANEAFIVDLPDKKVRHVGARYEPRAPVAPIDQHAVRPRARHRPLSALAFWRLSLFVPVARVMSKAARRGN